MRSLPQHTVYMKTLQRHAVCFANWDTRCRETGIVGGEQITIYNYTEDYSMRTADYSALSSVNEDGSLTFTDAEDIRDIMESAILNRNSTLYEEMGYNISVVTERTVAGKKQGIIILYVQERHGPRLYGRRHSKGVAEEIEKNRPVKVVKNMQGCYIIVLLL